MQKGHAWKKGITFIPQGEKAVVRLDGLDYPKVVDANSALRNACLSRNSTPKFKQQA